MRIALLILASFLAPVALSAGSSWSAKHDFTAPRQPLPGWFYVKHPDWRKA